MTYICHRNQDEEEAERATAFFAKNGIETIVVNRTVPRKNGPGFYLRLAANLLSPLPYSVASHRSERLRAAVADFTAANPVDLFQLEWTGYLHALPPGAAAGVQAHNVDSLLWQRYHQAEARTRIPSLGPPGGAGPRRNRWPLSSCVTRSA